MANEKREIHRNKRNSNPLSLPSKDPNERVLAEKLQKVTDQALDADSI